MIKLYKDGDRMGICTDCTDEAAFLAEFSVVWGEVVRGGQFGVEWPYQLRLWLPQVVDICCKLRGYQTPIVERHFFLSGSGDGIPLVASLDRDGIAARMNLPDSTDKCAKAGCHRSRTPSTNWRVEHQKCGLNATCDNLSPVVEEPKATND